MTHRAASVAVLLVQLLLRPLFVDLSAFGFLGPSHENFGLSLSWCSGTAVETAGMGGAASQTKDGKVEAGS